MSSNESIFESLRALVKSANGMLPFDVYKELFFCGQNYGHGGILEIGTAHAAATIAMGLGAKSSGRSFHIHTIDPLGGRFSSRSAYGDVSTNLEIVNRNLNKAGISDNVSFFNGTSTEFYVLGKTPETLTLVMLDADGRIDRDFLFFYQKMPSGSMLVIDDVDDAIAFHKNPVGEVYIDQKFRITFLLLKKYEEMGLIHIRKKIVGTVFAETTGIKIDREKFLEVSLECYRELVSSVTNDPIWMELYDWALRRKYIQPWSKFISRLAAGKRLLKSILRRG